MLNESQDVAQLPEFVYHAKGSCLFVRDSGDESALA